MKQMQAAPVAHPIALPVRFDLAPALRADRSLLGSKGVPRAALRANKLSILKTGLQSPKAVTALAATSVTPAWQQGDIDTDQPDESTEGHQHHHKGLGPLHTQQRSQPKVKPPDKVNPQHAQPCGEKSKKAPPPLECGPPDKHGINHQEHHGPCVRSSKRALRVNRTRPPA
ncbi:MAG: hypothetical protein U0573_07710 [Phycisphaerales bacterium]|nr:hypothetical protein [Planctomycetota bacterium]